MENNDNDAKSGKNWLSSGREKIFFSFLYATKRKESWNSLFNGKLA